jgi:hypothetical protein
MATITLNWDTTLWHNENPLFNNLIQLHGIAGFDESIVLPMEQTPYDEIANLFSVFDDKHLLHEWQKACQHKFGNELFLKLRYRENAASEQLRLAHSLFIQWIEACENIYIWGVGFNDYDAEVSTVIRSVRDKGGFKHKVVTVINPDQKQRYRVAELFGIHPYEVEYINPSKQTLLSLMKRTLKIR